MSRAFVKTSIAVLSAGALAGTAERSIAQEAASSYGPSQSCEAFGYPTYDPVVETHTFDPYTGVKDVDGPEDEVSNSGNVNDDYDTFLSCNGSEAATENCARLGAYVFTVASAPTSNGQYPNGEPDSRYTCRQEVDRFPASPETSKPSDDTTYQYELAKACGQFSLLGSTIRLSTTTRSNGSSRARLTGYTASAVDPGGDCETLPPELQSERKSVKLEMVEVNSHGQFVRKLSPKRIYKKGQDAESFNKGFRLRACRDSQSERFVGVRQTVRALIEGDINKVKVTIPKPLIQQQDC